MTEIMQRKIGLLHLVLVWMAMSLSAQETNHFIRSFNNSLVQSFSSKKLEKIEFDDKSISEKKEVSKIESHKYVFGAFGGLISVNNDENRYLYTGQEYDFEFKFNIFPSRIYIAKNKRFLQPDPANQYFSPYCYVNGDPVNYVDYDGNEGKPLILYKAETNYSGQMTNVIKDDFQAVVGEAHYMALPDFMNPSQSLVLPDWNGNVFLLGEQSPAGSVVGESTLFYNRIHTRGLSNASTFRMEQDGAFHIGYDNNTISRRLSDAVEANRVQQLRIMNGASEGGATARSLAQQTHDLNSRRGIHVPVKSNGLKKGAFAHYLGPQSNDVATLTMNTDDIARARLPRATNTHFVVRDNPAAMHMEGGFRNSTFPIDRTTHYRINSAASGGEVSSIVNSEVPERLAGYFEPYMAGGVMY